VAGSPARQRPRPAGAAARRAERPTHILGTIRPDPGSRRSAHRPPTPPGAHSRASQKPVCGFAASSQSLLMPARTVIRAGGWRACWWCAWCRGQPWRYRRRPARRWRRSGAEAAVGQQAGGASQDLRVGDRVDVAAAGALAGGVERRGHAGAGLQRPVIGARGEGDQVDERVGPLGGALAHGSYDIALTRDELGDTQVAQ
jgi:hypothetical protein